MRKIRFFELSSEVVNPIESTEAVITNTRQSSTSSSDMEFKENIDALVEQKVAAYKGELSASFAAEMEKHKKIALSNIDDELNKLKNLNASLEALISNVQSELDNKLISETQSIQNAVVVLVMEALYKLIGLENISSTIVENIVNILIEKLNNDSAAKLNVSSVDYKLLEAMECFNQIKSAIFLDINLIPGQVVLEDNASLYHMGVLDRLDALRKSFITALSKENEI